VCIDRRPALAVAAAIIIIFICADDIGMKLLGE
jgi:hypothetical protein